VVQGQTGREELEWRCCRAGLIDIPAMRGARSNWSVAGRGTAAATRDGVLAVGVCVCVCVLAAADYQCSRRINH